MGTLKTGEFERTCLASKGQNQVTRPSVEIEFQIRVPPNPLSTQHPDKFFLQDLGTLLLRVCLAAEAYCSEHRAGQARPEAQSMQPPHNENGSWCKHHSSMLLGRAVLRHGPHRVTEVGYDTISGVQYSHLFINLTCPGFLPFPSPLLCPQPCFQGSLPNKLLTLGSLSQGWHLGEMQLQMMFPLLY